MNYNNLNRGKIQYPNRAKQIIDYSGLRFGNKTPMDIDGYMEFGGKCAIVLEFKTKGKELPYGQRIALEVYADGVCGFPVIVIVADHYVIDAAKEIKADQCIVREYYYNGAWHPTDRMVTVRQFVDSFVKQYA